MGIFRILQPKATISEKERSRGLRMLTAEGIVSLGFSSITTSGLLAAFALALGANNLQIGVLAAIPFIMQLFQIPSVILVERFRKRKLIAVSAWTVAQLVWFPIACIPYFIKAPSSGAIAALLGLMAFRSILHAVTNCAWTSWIKDLVPKEIMGRFFSRRLALSTLLAAGFALVSALFIDYWKGYALVSDHVFAYSYVLLIGAFIMGMSSPLFMSKMPEPEMQRQTGTEQSIISRLMIPIRDRNFRGLLRFLLLWGFASNLAIPFFAVYMLQRLGLSLLIVIALGVLSQICYVLFIRVWGKFADKYGYKAILSLSASLYLLIILGWTFTTMPERYFLTIPLLVVLHIFAGIAAAGVTLGVGTISLKLAPEEQSTAYLSSAALATNIGAGLGPIAGGLFADYFKVRQISLDFSWVDPSRTLHIGILNLTSYDFLFAIAFIIGIFTLNTLITVREEGEVGKQAVMDELMVQSRTINGTTSSIPRLGLLGILPFRLLRRVPGMDVAIGVTNYGLTDIVNKVTAASSKGRINARKIRKSIENGVLDMYASIDNKQLDSSKITEEAFQSAVQAERELGAKSEDFIGHIMIGVLRAMHKLNLSDKESFYGFGLGTVNGAYNSGKDVNEAAVQATKQARKVARESSLDEKVILSYTRDGILTGARAIGNDVFNQLESILPLELS